MGAGFANPLEELQEYQDIEKSLNKGLGPLQISGCLDSQKVHLMHQLGVKKPFRVIVTYDESRAKEIYEDCKYFEQNVWLYPAKDLLFYSADIHGNLLTRQRLLAFKHLLEDDGGVFITTLDGCMDHLLPLESLKSGVLSLQEGQSINIEELKKTLVRMGYERTAQVEGMGQFSVRGEIVDIFPLTEENPLRIDLWGDEIDTIKSFDAESQRSVERLEEVDIYPATELVFDEEELEAGIERLQKEAKKQEKVFRDNIKPEEAHRVKATVEELVEDLKDGYVAGRLDGYVAYFSDQSVSFLDYFDHARTLVFLDEPQRLVDKGNTVELEFRESMARRLEFGYILPGQTELLYTSKEIFGRLQRPGVILMTGLEQKLSAFAVEKRYSMMVQNVNSYQNSFELLIKDLKRWKKEGDRVVLLSGSRTRASRLASDLREYELRAFYNDEEGYQVSPGEILVTYGNLHKGFEYTLIKFVVITEGDIFGAEKKKRKKKKTSYEGQKIQSFTDLAIGDYVVHENHGLGIYKGIEKIERDKITKDYIKIQYGDGGNLYLPATQLEAIQKYAGSDAKKPKLNKLGGTEWSKTKTRVRSAVKDVAKDLVQLYASRQKSHGYQYGTDTVWQREFEELFPYEETEDQLQAIEDAKADMESTKIMDRLICGDVGYGKTEIALRAAFKAVQEGKQVVYLVPTTILAQQHYNTFVQRMKDFPVVVELMCRFRTPAQMNRTIEDLRKGMVDIVIGTHRVLSKDVRFKDLGLLIIDEEQRFGVTHKEKIKQLKENVDVMTLTATPIPRTLHMSLIGIRDMSVLEEPPVDRVPIQTYVMEQNDEMIREAINRELARNGQVYYVYNRVKDIDEVANHIAALVPEASVAFAHGQMRQHELERIMFDFINGETDVLVSTTIIETGLDISNVNTMIIQDADQLGLSQLYQLRGRVGRSSRVAYAFLMYRRNKLLREEAEKRLQAIREFTELGSGIKIAMRDLEIRGAGNILGAEQHGHMEAVGYDLYCKLLNEAVKALQGQAPEENFETTVDCDIDAFIPATYIRNEYQKLDIYKRISGIENEEEYSDMLDELEDRFGNMPRSVENLLKIALLKSLAHNADVSEVVMNRQECRLVMYQKARINVAAIPALIEKYSSQLKFVTTEQPYFLYTDMKTKNTKGPAQRQPGDSKDMDTMMESVKILLNEIKLLLER